MKVFQFGSSAVCRTTTMTSQLFLGVFVVFSLLKLSAAAKDDFLKDTFPPGFRWGTATSSYQIEGAWNVDGKGESIWDRFCHEGGHVINNETGDIACDSYNKYEDDIKILKDLGVNFYRFSLSWPRILPKGTLEVVNEAGIGYYNRLIDGLLVKGIEPMATIYHWDLPQALEGDGGWLNPNIVNHFNDYSRLCFQRFGDRVKLWITINEPIAIAYGAYGVGWLAPGIKSPGELPYQVAHNLIKSHAEAWHTYDKEFKSIQKGRVSTSLVGLWSEPSTNSKEDFAAAERALQFSLGWYAHPICVNGDYPEVMKEYVARKSRLEGRNTSRLPEFTDAEKRRIAGTYDFFAVNHYTTSLVENYDYENTTQPDYVFDQDTKTHADPSWPETGTDFNKEVPWGMRKMLVWIKVQYNNPEVMITENGVSDDKEHKGSLNDQQRIRFYTKYINNVLKAIKLDGCKVSAYTAWSLMDNFEWILGYGTTFGLHQVNFSDPTRARVPKASAAFYKKLIQDNGWPSSGISATPLVTLMISALACALFLHS